MTELKRVVEEEFESEVLKSDVPVVVDFSAEWCGPCKVLKPVMGKAALKHKDAAKFYFVDIESDPDLANKYRVMMLPTVLVFSRGKVVGNMVGFPQKPMQELDGLVSRAISKAKS
jgi:thioredoxin 1